MKKRWRSLLAWSFLLALIGTAVGACGPTTTIQPLLDNPYRNHSYWYRGNTHTHTNVSSDGELYCTEVLARYAQAGYDFLVITNHNSTVACGAGGGSSSPDLFQGCLRSKIVPGIVAVIQTFGDRLNFHPHLHILVIQGVTAPDNNFHKISPFRDDLIKELFTQEVLSLLVREKLINL